MKYIRLFNSASAFSSEYYDDSEYIEPWLSIIKDNPKPTYNKSNYDIYFSKYFTIEVVEGGTFKIESTNSLSNKGWNSTKACAYSTNNGSSWTWDFIKMGSQTLTLNVSAGDIIIFKGTSYGVNAPDGIWSNCYSTSTNFYIKISGTATFNAYGNIGSLIFQDDFMNSDYTFDRDNESGIYFYRLFKTSNLISAENLILPKDGVFRDMFSDTMIKP